MVVPGFADLHIHQFANLGFGGVMFFGSPSGDVSQVLPWCDHVHGAGGLGDIITPAVRSQTYGGVSLGHKVGGSPQFDGWPRWDSITHQAVHVDWLERAWRGGLRLMVMLAVNNEEMCKLPGMPRAPGRTCADMEAVDLQLQAARDLQAYVDQANGGPSQGWYRLVQDPSEARAVIDAGKLAVVLGIEVDYLFNSYPASNLTQDDVRNSLDIYYAAGVRYVLPIHLGNNAFGGTAFYLGLQHDRGAPIGSPRNPLIDLAFYEVDTQDARDLGYELRGGRRNVLGLTELGKFLLQELIARGMIFDINHMSYQARADALSIAEAARYPVVAGHTGFLDVSLGDKRHEGQLNANEVERIRALGGMVCPIVNQGGIKEIDTWHDPQRPPIYHICGNSSNSLLQAYLYAVNKMQGAPVAIGTDFNGFNGLPGPRAGPDRCPGGGTGTDSGAVAYPFLAASGIAMERSHIGNKTFDITTDGLAHVGMLPDLVEDLQVQGLTKEELAPLLQSVEGFIGLWTTAWAGRRQTQRDWRWCAKCDGLFWAGGQTSAGTCPGSGHHDRGASSDYNLVMDTARGQGQHDWRWCNKCSGLFWAGGQDSAGTCPAGGSHARATSSDYCVIMDVAASPGQHGWRWCAQCSGLFWAGHPTGGACPAGGTHVMGGNSDYCLTMQ